MKPPKYLGFFIAAIILTLLSCSDQDFSKEKYDQLITDSLKQGSSSEQIISFLEENNWEYVFDKNRKRYQVFNSAEDKLPDISGRNLIFIYVDEQKKYKKYEIEKIFNSL